MINVFVSKINFCGCNKSSGKVDQNKIKGSLLGFTLAEVLITLGIIGVVAAMTIPTLVSGAQDKANVTAAKKAYMTLSLAVTSSVNENGSISSWDLSPGIDSASAMKSMNYLAPYLSVAKMCGTNGGCFSGTYNQPSGKTDTTDGLNYQNANSPWATAQLSDGSSIAVLSGAAWWKGIYIVYDTNGPKAPNQYGKDTFWFLVAAKGENIDGAAIVNDGISPVGGWQAPLATCNRTADTPTNGRGCAAWVIQNGNTDYFKCDDLAWGTKTKCN